MSAEGLSMQSSVDEKLCLQRCSDIQRQMDTAKEEISLLFRAVDDIKQSLASRLPLWATMLIGLLMAIIGWLAKAVL